MFRKKMQVEVICIEECIRARRIIYVVPNTFDKSLIEPRQEQKWHDIMHVGVWRGGI